MNHLIGFLLVGVLIISCTAQIGKFEMYEQVTLEQEVSVEKLCREELLDKRIDRIAGFVRLVFHDCVGPNGCNGCIDVTNPDNAGMEHHMDALEEVYDDNNIRQIMSRADFWMLCANAAIKRGLDGTEVKPENFPYVTKYGRTDCDEENPKQTSAADKYPSPHGNHSHTTGYFSEEFGLTAEETTALLGAHTLGRGHEQFSGFKNAWVEEEFTFDNQFYKDMLNEELNWTQVDVSANTSTPPKYQYVRGDGTFFMLTSDLVLVKDISVDAHGRLINGTIKDYPDSLSHSLSEIYANDMSVWIRTFSQAYTKMTEKVNSGIALSQPQKQTDNSGSITHVTISLLSSLLFVCLL